ncbi:MAG: carboxymuconolactone decarboxylase [Roseateles depolymerans]|uniref:Carboxymuconolactone decarboxylase n=1 Tax=Roseateles depolymerans TaxID=76731 RepID=A0A2W5DT68_9BURK|nr:MAG: carboxymuconolactone decarboxylase [Roseateles depolymerans]
MKPLITAAAVALAIAEPGVAAEADLQISRAGSRAAYTAPAQYFTGLVRVEMLQTPSGAERASAGSVSFSPGARTAWHSHPLGQTLVVTAGVGRIQRWGGPVEEIRVGDVVHIPPHVKHWHGAAADSAMTHIAITEMQDGSAADWMEQVSEADYRVAPVPMPATASAPSQGQKLFGDIAPKFGQLTDEVLFGDVWARPGLSRRDRSLATVSALTALYRPEQLRSHLALARQNGLSEAELVEVITQLAFYAGWPNAVTALGVAREVFAADKP